VPLFAELCYLIERCEPQLLELFAASSVDACVEWATCTDSQRSWGRTLGDAQGCAEFVRGASCDEVPISFNPVSTLGRLPSIGGVTFDVSAGCTPRSTVFGGTTLGPGETCLTSEGEGVSCGVDYFCEISSPELMKGLGYCGTCAPLATLGDSCSDDHPCARPARCVDGICGEPLGLGAACTNSGECATGYCHDRTCLEFGANAPPGFIVHHDQVLGQPCNPYDNGDACKSTPFTACVDYVCVPRADEGEPCVVGAGQCRAGQMCHQGVCTRAACVTEPGDPCEFSCSGGTCDADAGLCMPWPTLGEPCEVLCQSPYVCSGFGEGFCVALNPNGSGCRESGECASNFCDRDYAPYCDHQVCAVPACDQVCGTCNDPPKRTACD